MSSIILRQSHTIVCCLKVNSVYDASQSSEQFAEQLDLPHSHISGATCQIQITAAATRTLMAKNCENLSERIICGLRRLTSWQTSVNQVRSPLQSSTMLCKVQPVAPVQCSVVGRCRVSLAQLCCPASPFTITDSLPVSSTAAPTAQCEEAEGAKETDTQGMSFSNILYTVLQTYA